MGLRWLLWVHDRSQPWAYGWGCHYDNENAVATVCHMHHFHHFLPLVALANVVVVAVVAVVSLILFILFLFLLCSSAPWMHARLVCHLRSTGRPFHAERGAAVRATSLAAVFFWVLRDQ